MKIIKEYHICDRCKSVIKGKEIHKVFDYTYQYELCNLCKHEYDEFSIHVNALKRNWERLEEKYKFGKYLPKEKTEE